MKAEDLHELFDESFLNQPVDIKTNNKMITEESEEMIMSYSGLLLGYDDFNLYLGQELGGLFYACVPWSTVVDITREVPTESMELAN